MRAFVLAFAVSSMMATTLLVACSSNDHPPAATTSSSSGSVTASSSSSGGTDAGGDADAEDAEASLPSENDALCVGLDAPPRVIAEVSEPGDVPTPYGGDIVTGDYELDELLVYGAATGDGGEGPVEALTGNSGSGTLVITSNTLAFNDSYGPTASVPAAAARGYAYYATGTTISEAQVCPTLVATVPIPYSAEGSSITFFPVPTRRVVYRLKAGQ